MASQSRFSERDPHSSGTMAADTKPTGPLESGTYIIRCVQALSYPLTLVRREEGKKPAVTNWKTLKSPTERWIVECGEEGYRFRNASTNLYMSIENQEPFSGQPILGLRHAVEWKVEKKEDDIYHVKLATNPKLVLDLMSFQGTNGAEMIICDDYHGKVNQQWTFEKVLSHEEPPSYAAQLHIGPVPAGIYWLGHPYEYSKSADGQDIAKFRAPSTSALGATAYLPLGEDEKAYAHLSAIEKGPLVHQIWALEPGRHGYRLRSVAVNAYLNYVQSEPVLESISLGPSAISEWSLWWDPEYPTSNVPTWMIRPCADHNVAIGVTKGDAFIKLRARTMDAWVKERQIQKEGQTYRRWRFEPVEEKYLDTSFVSASVDELLRRPHV